MCENHAIWRFSFFSKILDVQNKAVVIIAYVYVSKTTPPSKTIGLLTTICIKQNM
jgi:hypothetical protein